MPTTGTKGNASAVVNIFPKKFQSIVIMSITDFLSNESTKFRIWLGSVCHVIAWFITVRYRPIWTPRRYAKSRNTEKNSKCEIYKYIAFVKMQMY